ncbi:MAG TPA: hypothetical protein VFE08_10380 [Candidatus Sulfotelmatobacter sp.]|jgi:hypothetical protein|nr:hypothetical protein [Candidatus Sulfotelmatobacter sp.]
MAHSAAVIEGHRTPIAKFLTTPQVTSEALPNFFDLIEALSAEIKLMKSADQIKKAFLSQKLRGKRLPKSI